MDCICLFPRCHPLPRRYCHHQRRKHILPPDLEGIKLIEDKKVQMRDQWTLRCCCQC